MQRDAKGNLFLNGKLVGREVSPNFEILIATEDGSLGFKGTVLDLLQEVSPAKGEVKKK